MTLIEVRRAIKANAFKQIRRLVKSAYCQYECGPNDSAVEARYYRIEEIIEEMDKKLYESRMKEKKSKEIKQ